MDVNTAPRERLLRVPGLGVATVDKLLRIRRGHRVTLGDLVTLRVRMTEARHFVVTADSMPLAGAPTQLDVPVQQRLL